MFSISKTPFKCLPCVADEDLPAAVSQFESANKGKCFPLEKPAGAILRKAELEDTVYKDYPADVNGWGKFYLPTTVTMQIIGVVEGISCLCDQLVLMTCKDKQVYGYDGEELHLVASSIKQLLDEGMEYPASKTYYKGEAFKDMVRNYICLLGITKLSWLIILISLLTFCAFLVCLCLDQEGLGTGVEEPCGEEVG